MMLILWSWYSMGATASDSERPRLTSSGSVSQTVDPSSTRPIRVITPVWWRSASASVVLPEPPWPTSATLRTLSGAYPFNLAPSLVEPAAEQSAGKPRLCPGGTGGQEDTEAYES